MRGCLFGQTVISHAARPPDPCRIFPLWQRHFLSAPRSRGPFLLKARRSPARSRAGFFMPCLPDPLADAGRTRRGYAAADRLGQLLSRTRAGRMPPRDSCAVVGPSRGRRPRLRRCHAEGRGAPSRRRAGLAMSISPAGKGLPRGHWPASGKLAGCAATCRLLRGRGPGFSAAPAVAPPCGPSLRAGPRGACLRPVRPRAMLAGPSRHNFKPGGGTPFRYGHS